MNGGADLHCDALSKLLTGEATAFTGKGSETLDVSFEQLALSGNRFQCFAVYIPERMEQSVHAVLRSIDLYYEHLASHPRIQHILTESDLDQALQDGRIAAMLSLEGVDALQGDLAALRMMFRLGVRSVGITWNHANWAADGVMEPRGGGLTRKGKELVTLCNEMGILIDVSHLAEKGFWEVLELSNKPVYASHSNAKSICDHPRNLTDAQIEAIFSTGGIVGITYVPWFVSRKPIVTIEDLRPHFEHLLQLGGENYTALGSDFDGIDRYIRSLRNPAEAAGLYSKLQDWFGETVGNKIISQNALSFLRASLPQA